MAIIPELSTYSSEQGGLRPRDAERDWLSHPTGSGTIELDIYREDHLELDGERFDYEPNRYVVLAGGFGITKEDEAGLARGLKAEHYGVIAYDNPANNRRRSKLSSLDYRAATLGAVLEQVPARASYTIVAQSAGGDAVSRLAPQLLEDDRLDGIIAYAPASFHKTVPPLRLVMGALAEASESLFASQRGFRQEYIAALAVGRYMNSKWLDASHEIGELAESTGGWEALEKLSASGLAVNLIVPKKDRLLNPDEFHDGLARRGDALLQQSFQAETYLQGRHCSYPDDPYLQSRISELLPPAINPELLASLRAAADDISEPA